MATSLKKKQSSKSKSAKKSFPKKAKRGGKKAPAKRTIKKTAPVKKMVKKTAKKPVKKLVKKSSPASKKTIKKPSKKAVKIKKKIVKKITKKPVKSLKKPILKKKPVKKIKKVSVKKPVVKKVKKAAPAKKKLVKKAPKKAVRKPVTKKAPAPKKPAVKKVPVSKPTAPISVPKPAAAPKPTIAPTPQPTPVIQQPQAPVTPKLSTEVQGVALIEAVIEKIKRDNLTRFGGYSMNGPRPLSDGQISSLTFPGGKPLSPSIKRWLQFDSSWLEELGWLEITGSDVSFTSKSISEFSAKEYGDDMKEFFEPFDRVFPGKMYLLPLGSDSRRALYVGNPDQTGEYPVIYTDIDDGAAVGLMYPGFDVYMADLVGLFELKFGTYTDLCNHPSFSARMKSHSDNNLRGRVDVDSFDAEEMLGQ
jgi:hypothetical protein